MPTDIGYPRLGMIDAKKVARNAVDRNYMKRMLRELFRHEHRRLGSLDLVVRPQKAFTQRDFAQVREEFLVALGRVRSRTTGGGR